MLRRLAFETELPEGFHRVRRWGDPVMLRYGFDLGDRLAHFQAVRLWNEFTGFGGVTNFLTIYKDDIQRIRALQVPSAQYDADSKMNWLFGDGKIFFNVADWEIAAFCRWGTIALGGNIVRVEGYEWITVNLDGVKVRTAMARLAGFRRSDWSKPLEQLIREGKVHRAYCVYPGNRFGDSPKGEVYTPFFSPLDWDFSGQNQPRAFYIPKEWLE